MTSVKEQMGDHGFCVNCVKGACIPTTVKYMGHDLNVSGCIAANLFYSGFVEHPEKLCDCFNKFPDKHRRESYGPLKPKQTILFNDDSTMSTGVALVQKDVVEDPTA